MPFDRPPVRTAALLLGLLLAAGCGRFAPPEPRAQDDGSLRYPAFALESRSEKEQAALARRRDDRDEATAAAAFLKTTLAAAPDDPDTLMALAWAVQSQSDYAPSRRQRYEMFQESAAYLRRFAGNHLVLLERDRRVARLVYYNEACVLALRDRPDEAMDALWQAIAHGWINGRHAVADPDLVSLHQRPDFHAMIDPLVARQPENDTSESFDSERRRRHAGLTPADHPQGISR